MKKVLFDEGGRPWANDDLETLQEEVYSALYATLQDAPPMALSGCQVTVQPGGGRGSIGAGLLWHSGEVHHYAGVADIALPAEIVLGDVELSDERAYQTGGSKACMSERQLITQARTADVVAKLVVVAGPELTYWKWIESRQRTVGEVQWLANLRPDDYDMTGKGWTDLASRGWAVCNGQNGTADLRGQFVVGYDPSRPDYDTIGKTGGEEKHRLTVAELPTFTPRTNAMKANGSVNRDTGGSAVAQFGGPASVDPIGGDQPHENRPPFYVLAARQWIGL